MRQMNLPEISQEQQELAWPFGTCDPIKRRAIAEKIAQDIIEATLPAEYRAWPRIMIVGSKEIPETAVQTIRGYVEHQPHEQVFITGPNGKSNRTVAETVRDSRLLVVSPEMARPGVKGLKLDAPGMTAKMKLEAGFRKLQATDEADLVCLALATAGIIVFRYGNSSGASGLITTARAVFNKQVTKIELAA